MEELKIFKGRQTTSIFIAYYGSSLVLGRPISIHHALTTYRGSYHIFLFASNPLQCNIKWLHLKEKCTLLSSNMKLGTHSILCIDSYKCAGQLEKGHKGVIFTLIMSKSNLHKILNTRDRVH